MTIAHLETQTTNALDFLQKLFFEISYLIKEVEGLLQHEGFRIGKPSGYGVTSGKSTGLEAVNVESWLSKSFTVFFVASDDCTDYKGQTITDFKDGLKVLFLDIELQGRKTKVPTITAGMLYNIRTKRPDFTKFEQVMNHVFFYYRDKISVSRDSLKYEDSYLAFEGKVHSLPLFAVQSTEDVLQKIVTPMLTEYGNR
ncbi:hypothetical protein KP004_08965 [Geomonas oryzisoli]|uniref:Uncharacterized protein n=1 Tax=Geomonas oryzisoli TaxID=2847992 RepID=A0ABX8JA24_9BACT|nr:hypothetical protein [Geomonas oryzisoli]QWV95284.1 hypothetical protein KP004_08965 [Geomonas oryzisoli]